MNNQQLVEKIFTICTEKKYTIATAESITGGRIASELTALDGSSKIFSAGVVCYSEHSKVHSAGVDIRLVNKVGVYHEKIVAQMAERIAKRNVANIGIATSGRADTGEVFFGFYIKEKLLKTLLVNLNDEKEYKGTEKLTRVEVQNAATNFSLSYILNLLQSV
ncbi:TPA: CinA family protein [Candidatus Peregrinibacteria bacterium]|nr:CinA family protein [Candidatus Peregrinibacteria bacterium]HIQ57441.1 CinA family protein [Candidatus Gracilibacteria bacterium]